ncbi:MAG: tyrosine-type recombinase/integrase [Bacteroidetes bacterium]|nr:tyrosine-type recombinase/integrase [Bacteroidota bacterium]
MHIESFIKYLQLEKRYSNNTVISYQNDLTQFDTFLKTNYTDIHIANFNHKQVRLWLSDLINEGVTPRSVNRKITSLKSFCKYLLQRDIINQNPMEKVTSPKTPKQLPVFVGQENMENLFENNIFTNDFNGIRARFLFELFYSTGMRLSELINIKTVDFDWLNMTVKVTGKRNKQRIIPLIPSIKNTFQQYNEYKKKHNKEHSLKESEYVFVTDKGNKLYSKFAYRIVHSYLGIVSTINKRSPHVLRHTFATHMLNEGAELNAIKEILGHANLSATQVYTHNTIEKLKKVYKQAHPKA